MSSEDIAIRLWPAHKLEHNVTFENADEERRRLGNFKENHMFIHNFNIHNKKYHYCRHNQLSHWSHEEYIAWLTLKPGLTQHLLQPGSTQQSSKQPEQVSKELKSSLPSVVDWKAIGKVTNIKNQGRCGSCWSFSATGAIESAYAIKTGELINFSEQQLVDCSTQNNGCDGGLPAVAFQYVIENGIMRWRDYPYTGQQGTCQYSSKDVVKISSYQYVAPNETSLMEAVATIGPISIAINASSRSFQFYGGGIYYDPLVPSYPLDHAVLLAGYGYQNNDNFWYVKNSWGTWWGEQGYVYIKRDDDNYLGVTSCASYPIM